MQIERQARVMLAAIALLLFCTPSNGQQPVNITNAARPLMTSSASVIQDDTQPRINVSSKPQSHEDQSETYTTRRRSLFTRISRYAATHKEFLVADSLVFLALSADAASSIHCVNVGCNEINPILGRHPSQLQYWGSMMGISTTVVAANHAVWRHARKHEVWVFSIPAIAVGAFDTHNSVNSAEIMQQCALRQARFRLAQSVPLP
jgi:hypothetical protein